MAYARRDTDSDLYLIASGDYFVCYGRTILHDDHIIMFDLQEVHQHLLNHIAAQDKVSAQTLQRIIREKGE